MPEKEARDPEKPERVRLSRAGQKLKKISFERLQRRLENIIDRHSRELWRKVTEEELNKDDSNAACNYLKLLKELKKAEDEKLNAMTDEELEKLIAKA